MVEVAERAGVSHSTVSRVLSGAVGVHPETRDVVLRAVQEMGYTVNSGARSLAGGRSSVVGVVVYDFESVYVARFVTAMERVLSAAGYSMLLGSAQGRDVDPHPHIAQLAQHNICDGLILLFPGYHRSFLDERNRQTLPFVLIDQPGSPIADSVYVDNYGGVRQAVEYLAELGHRRIGYIGGHMMTAAGRHRLDGFRQALHELQLDTDERLLAEGDFRQPAAYEGTRQFLALDDPPTAIFAGSDDAAVAVIAACQEQGFEVPNDMSVVGFDDLPLAELARPPLTTIRQPLDQVAERALEQLIRRIEEPKRGFEELRLATTLVERESTGPPPARPKSVRS